jgi:HK97 family phage portal protein
MKLVDRALIWLAGKLKEKGYLPGPGGIGFTKTWENSPYDYETLANAYIVNPWVHACVKRQAEVISGIPIKVYRESKDGEKEELIDHTLVDLLWNPGRFSGGTEGFLYNTVADFRLNGEFFWFCDNGTKGESIYPATLQELRLYKSSQMTPIPDKLDIISGYEYRYGGESITLDPEFIVHAKEYNPKDVYRGLPPLQVARNPVLLHYYMTRYNQLFFKNGANVGNVLSTDLPLKQEQQDALIAAWDKQHQGLEKSHKTAVMSHGLKPHSMGTSHKDAQFTELETLTRQEVLAIFMMPHVLVGLSESVNYANAREQVRIFFKYTVKPICRFIQGAINTQLIPVWYGTEEGLYVQFDFSDEEALQTDALTQAKERQIYVSSGIMTANEVRRELSLEDHEDGDGLKGGGGFPTGLLNKPRSFIKATVAPTRIDQWKARDRDFIESERKLDKIIAEFFIEQGKRVARKLEAVGLLAGVMPQDLRISFVSTVRQIEPSKLFEIFDLESENDEIVKALMPIILDIIEQVGGGAIDSVGSAIEFNIENPRVIAFLKRKELLIRNINNVTADVIRDILVDANIEGVSVTETASRIRDTFEEFSRVRAQTIARTEAVSANNAAALEGYFQSGVVTKKEWLSAKDDRVRDSHEAIDGSQVPIDEPFNNGLMSPGVDGPPEEVINCRCTLLPVLEDD